MAGFESGDLVLGNEDRSLGGNVTGDLLSAYLGDETTETTDVNILTFGYILLNGLQRALENRENRVLVITIFGLCRQLKTIIFMI